MTCHSETCFDYENGVSLQILGLLNKNLGLEAKTKGLRIDRNDTRGQVPRLKTSSSNSVYYFVHCSRPSIQLLVCRRRIMIDHDHRCIENSFDVQTITQLTVRLLLRPVATISMNNDGHLVCVTG